MTKRETANSIAVWRGTLIHCISRDTFTLQLEASATQYRDYRVLKLPWSSCSITVQAYLLYFPLAVAYTC